MSPDQTSAAPPAKRRRNSDLTRENIIEVATKEFADNGFAGARVDVIAERTHTTKRMIYYYFSDKEGLYTAVLERSYGEIRQQENKLDIAGLDPVAAIRALAELTFDHHDRHPDFIRLVANENMLHGEHIRKSAVLSGLGAPAADLVSQILAEGQQAGLFRTDVDALDVHMIISSYCVFRMANKYTWDALFKRDLTAPGSRDHQRTMLANMLVAFLRDTAH
ncbi:TetR family transcriptional regulator [Antrihabitans stalactiti]|uniref:TetR/AcrR family transcriptional regulator n=1 Tax=Antrihabitans stalactiti TaxID=2584121 RepID=A0A848KTN4_9NOCA|nr:TetR family transcriptional regulator [Antrihabitans stalactiti]NMN99520.1 TetR/AcrR family transcriptional regulator [Antrihabitans stalactiti]